MTSMFDTAAAPADAALLASLGRAAGYLAEGALEAAGIVCIISTIETEAVEQEGGCLLTQRCIVHLATPAVAPAAGRDRMVVDGEVYLVERIGRAGGLTRIALARRTLLERHATGQRRT